MDGSGFYELLREAKERRAKDTRTPAERRVDELNGESNWMDMKEYDCKRCDNRGWTAEVFENNGYQYVLTPECRCMEIRRAIWRMKASGLDRVIRKYTLDKFECTEPWQRAMLETARKYLKEGLPAGRWFFIGGQPGCGKTHICTGIAREALYSRPVVYMMWEEESKKLKATVTDAEAYGRAITPFKAAEVLYIDDLFKPTADEYGNPRKPTAADVKLAFEIVNYRYVNARPTIVSSEWTVRELADIDEATASRIAEACGEYQCVVARDRRKNHRFLN